MTVYSGFLTITKRNIRMVILYLIIFLSIAVLVQKATGGNMDEFEQVSLDIVTDRRTNGGIHAGRVTAACQNTYSLHKYHPLEKTFSIVFYHTIVEKSTVCIRFFYRLINFPPL